MARKNKQLSDAFKHFDTDKTKENETEKEHKSVTFSEHSNVNGQIQESEKVTVPETSTDSENNTDQKTDVITYTLTDVKKSLNDQFGDSKKKMEETHTRYTFLFRNDLSKRLTRLSKGKGKGFKTEFLNQAIEILLNEMEN